MMGSDQSADDTDLGNLSAELKNLNSRLRIRFEDLQADMSRAFFFVRLDSGHVDRIGLDKFTSLMQDRLASMKRIVQAIEDAWLFQWRQKKLFSERRGSEYPKQPEFSVESEALPTEPASIHVGIQKWGNRFSRTLSGFGNEVLSSTQNISSINEDNQAGYLRILREAVGIQRQVLLCVEESVHAARDAAMATYRIAND